MNGPPMFSTASRSLSVTIIASIAQKSIKVKIGGGISQVKKCYFYGVRIHILVTVHGDPVEFFLMPGSFSDTSALRLYDFDLPEKSWITGDKAYNDYLIEDIMREARLELVPLCKKNSLRKVPPYFFYLQSTVRKIVETTGSLIE